MEHDLVAVLRVLVPVAVVVALVYLADRGRRRERTPDPLLDSGFRPSGPGRASPDPDRAYLDLPVAAFAYGAAKEKRILLEQADPPRPRRAGELEQRRTEEEQARVAVVEALARARALPPSTRSPMAEEVAGVCQELEQAASLAELEAVFRRCDDAWTRWNAWYKVGHAPRWLEQQDRHQPAPPRSS